LKNLRKKNSDVQKNSLWLQTLISWCLSVYRIGRRGIVKLKKFYRERFMPKLRRWVYSIISDYWLIAHSRFFDANWYKKMYDLQDDQDPVIHYLQHGHDISYFPSEKFSGLAYYTANPDVKQSGINPLLHYERYGAKEGRSCSFTDYMLLNAPSDASEVETLLNRLETLSRKSRHIQDNNIEKNYPADAKKLIVFMVPPLDYVGGGIMSICSIAKVTKSLAVNRDAEIILVTWPSEQTFVKYTKFETDFDIYRFEQLPRYFKQVEEILVHLPEMHVYEFLTRATPYELLWLTGIHNRRANIMNQNNVLMPSVDITNELKKVFPKVSMTIAHKQYCRRQMRTSYDMSVHFFSTSNLVEYHYRDYRQKENLLVYSNDANVHKKNVLETLKVSFPEMKFVEIKDMKYAEYLKVISRAKWMITFGEGLDGYFLESIRSGTIPFAVNNNVFFDERFNDLPILFNSYSDMNSLIAESINRLDCEEEYAELSKKLIALDKVVYNDEEYKTNIKDYYEGKYTFPYDEVLSLREQTLKRQPLISVVMATFNGEMFLQKQLLSLNRLTYKNVEIIISDDGSTDDTLKIISEFNFKHPVKLLHNPGPRGVAYNFSYGLQHAQGEFIALCNQDDIWMENKLETLLEYIEDYDIIHAKCSVIDEEDKPHPADHMHEAYEIDKSKLIHFTDYFTTNNITANPLLVASTSLIRRSFLENILPLPTDLLSLDWWIALEAIKNGNGIAYIHKPVVYYRQHKKNATKVFENDISWLDKQYKYNTMVANRFDKMLSRQERAYLEANRNWCKMYQVFNAHMPNYCHEFFHANIFSLTNETLKYIEDAIKERLDVEEN